jgi:hypothetical protein
LFENFNNVKILAVRKLKAVLAVFFIFLPVILFADESLTADKILVSTPVYQSDYGTFKPALGQYEYSVSWQGIPAATVYFNVDKRGQKYFLSTDVKTVRAIDLFYKLRYRAEGQISAINYLPVYSTLVSQENSKERSSKIEFTPEGLIHSTYSVNGELKQELSFNPNNFMLDPFAAGFLARSLDWKKGQTRYFDTFNGKSRYLISFTAVDERDMFINGETRRVWVVEPKVKLLTADKAKKKLRTARIYITADSARDILKIDSEVFIGTVRTKLTAFRPSNSSSNVEIAEAQTVNFNF